jgi:hypothetical protein
MNVTMKKQKFRYFYLLYLLAFALIILFALRQELNIPEDLANYGYYIAIGIFVIGVIRVFYLIIKR